MSHKSDKSSNLSQLLRVETEENDIRPDSSNYFEEDKDGFNHNHGDEGDSLGPLPPRWEKAYTESGEVYFIDHSTGTSHWLDPRLSKFQKKSLEDCLDDELPYGWEKISDPHYGTYFIDHVNRRTQYENPVIQAKRAAAEASSRISHTSFTKDPAELCGQRLRTSLIKSSRGLGFTIVGGDDGVDEFLQIKSVVPKGPAWFDGRLLTGDVIVYVNDTCVLGYTHNQIVRLFQSIAVGSTVNLEVCRGYPLPFDPNDPNTEVVTTIAVDDHLQTVAPDKRLAFLDAAYKFLQGDEREEGLPQESSEDMEYFTKTMNNLSLKTAEVRVQIVKGHLGFGFTIADSAFGQRVKKILDRQRCKNLIEGDILLEINDVSLKNMSHDEVVQVLKNCPFDCEATVCVRRGSGSKSTLDTKNKSRKLDNRFANKDIGNSYRSKTPTADIYSTQQREILPSRPKTPLIDTRARSKTPVKDLNVSNNNDIIMYKKDAMNELYNPDLRSGMNSVDPAEMEENLEMTTDNAPNPEFLMSTDQKYPPYLSSPHRYECACFECHSYRSNGIEGDPNIKKNMYQDVWPVIHHAPEYIENTITLTRQENGFGFRIVGGFEDRSQVAVGHIVAGGAADLDGRIKTGDEIVSVDGYSVLKASHRQVVQLMNAAGSRGQVSLVLRRRIYPPMGDPYMRAMCGTNACMEKILPIYHPPMPPQHTYDVVVNRNENEGFGFVIISSVNKVGSTIGRLTEGSPAERCGRLRVGDYIVAVNHIDIMNFTHGEVVNLIKESGLSVTLTISPTQHL